MSTTPPFHKAILIGLVVQVLLLLCGVGYFAQVTSSHHYYGTDSSSSLHPDQLHVTSLLQEAIQLAAGRHNGGSSGSSRDLSAAASVYTRHHPMNGMIQSYASSMHDPTQKRLCFSFTAVPREIESLLIHVDNILGHNRYASLIDCIHLSIPHRALRFNKEPYPTTAELQRRITDPRIILHRSFDYGPMTRYIGPLSYEQHPDTSIVIFDMDSSDMFNSKEKDLALLFHASRFLDDSAMWCFQGENFKVAHNVVKPAWDTFPSQFTDDLEWNLVHFCRGVSGLLFKPKQFVNFWYNQSEYHESCFWDDDRWVGYQMERLKIPLKVVHPPKHMYIDLQPLLQEKSTVQRLRSQRQRRRLFSSSNETQDVDLSLSKPCISDTTKAAMQASAHRRLGSLTQITTALKSDQTCPLAWLKHHPDAFPTART